MKQSEKIRTQFEDILNSIKGLGSHSKGDYKEQQNDINEISEDCKNMVQKMNQ